MNLEPTPEQLAIVEYPLLPLRVTAGAGTGKTTTMALRLEHLVRSGQVEPEDALGITFTNKAAEELADRLRSRMTELAEEGREVEVNTYHGFAYALLREFGALVGIERDAGLITPGYARQLLRDSLGAGEHGTLDLTAPGPRVDELVILAGQLGDHLRDPADLLQSTEDETWERRSEMARVLCGYRARKRRLGVVDYADLIAAAHRLVVEHPEIADRIRNRYRVVLLDEYQDTNPAQREFLRSVFADGFPVTAVGDADQTIYEWRGASLQNFAEFDVHFPNPDGSPARTLHLSVNRRSSRRVIDLANRVRDEISARGDLDGLMPLEDAGPGTIRVGWFRTAVDEARWIAGEVRRLHAEGRRWSDVGILFRKHRQIGLIRDALEREGVPVEVAALGGLLDVPEIADLHAWLRILGRPDDAPALMRVLLGSRFRLGLGDLAPLAEWVRSHHDEGPDADLDAIGWALLEAVDRLEECEGLDDQAGLRLQAFRTLYRGLLATAQGVTLVDLCRAILDRSHAWLEVEALDDAARLSARLNLYRFLDLAEEWSPLEGRPSLEAFLDYLDLLGEDRAADELDTARISGEDAVALITVHRAKGLEWPVVLLPALCEGTFPSGARPYPDPRAHPQFLPYEWRLDAEHLPSLPEDDRARREVVQQRHSDQEWRTAYVAVTRAADTLTATGAHWYTDGTPKKQSGLYLLAAATEGAEVVSDVVEPGEPPDSLRFPDGPADGPDPAFPDGWRAALSRAVLDPAWPRARAEDRGKMAPYREAIDQLSLVLDGLPEARQLTMDEEPFHTSVTGLVTFATCPQRFFWSEVDRLPRRPSPAARRGIEVHRRIELHNRGAIPLAEAVEGFYDLDPAEPSSPGAFTVFRNSRFAEERPRFVEAPFDLKIGEARVSGRIDAVYEPEPDLWEVVDFKSGRPDELPARRVQLEAYGMAVREAGFAADPPERLRVVFAYLGDELVERAEDVDEAWLEQAHRHLEMLVAGASGGQRRPTPSEACRTCDYLRFCDSGRTWVDARH